MQKVFIGWVLPLLIAVVVVFVLWFMFRDRVYVVGGDNMSPTLTRGQRVWMDSDHNSLRRGDIVLVSTPNLSVSAESRRVFMKCECLPGMKVSRLRADHVYGHAILPEPGFKIPLNYANYVIYKDLAKTYEDADMQWCDSVCVVNGKVSDSYTFKRGYVFLINDNRADRYDSRTFGPVPQEWIVGKIKFVF
ncbi:MAG: signal peptidase I [Bacteroidales bacterium]|nr:signal peptidase I [Bacteroidales bacterium]